MMGLTRFTAPEQLGLVAIYGILEPQMRGDHFLSFYMNARALFLGPDSKGLRGSPDFGIRNSGLYRLLKYPAMLMMAFFLLSRLNRVGSTYASQYALRGTAVLPLKGLSDGNCTQEYCSNQCERGDPF